MGTVDELTQLHEGWMLDYDMQTWTVTECQTHSDADSPADVWTLKNGTDVRYLEHEHDEGDVFRLYEPARISEIAIENVQKGGKEEPFLAAIRSFGQGRTPKTILYEDEEYAVTEIDARVDAVEGVTKKTEGARREMDSDEGWKRSADDWMLMGVCGGYAEHKGVSSTLVRLAAIAVFFFVLSFLAIIIYVLIGLTTPVESPKEPQEVRASEDKRTHYWVYEKGDEFVAVECYGYNDWDAYAGHEVEPHEFDNVLPGSDE